MACGKFKRFTRGRRFLFEEEVQTLAESDDVSRKRLISALSIDDEIRGHLYKQTNADRVFEKLRRFGSGVCRIDVSARGYQYSGSGFHFGDGWVLTSSHVLRNREILNSARFVFVSPDCGEVTFEANPRRAIVHRLLPAGRRTDYHNRDITLTKLGLQFTQGRKRDQLEEWEIDEQQLLEKNNLFNFNSLANNSFSPEGEIPLNLRPSDQVLALIHFGGTNDKKTFSLYLAAREVWKFVDLRLVNFATPINPEASGCPVLLYKDGDWLLAGVFVAGALLGTQPRNAGAGQGVVWNRQVVEHLEAGRDTVNQMETFKSYSVFVPFQERLQLICDKSVKEAAQLAVEHRILII